MKTAQEIANYFTMRRFMLASIPQGHSDKEFFDLLADEINLYVESKLKEKNKELDICHKHITIIQNELIGVNSDVDIQINKLYDEIKLSNDKDRV